MYLLLLWLVNKSKTEKSNFKIIVDVLYACNPPYDVVVPILFIQPKCQNNNVTFALLGKVQKFASTILVVTGIFVWSTGNENRKKLSLIAN